ncbi:MAG: L-threonylcarbamoyladenylate synthase [Bacilli bacterium]
MTKIFNWNNIINPDELNEIVDAIKEGKLIIFPTETVYGIGASIYNENALKNIFITKNRAQDNPLIVHVSSIEMIRTIVENISPVEEKLINTFMPGPFTLILPKKSNISPIITANSEYVGVRMPNNIIIKTIIESSNIPLAAPSANLSTKPSCTTLKDILEDFNNKVEYIIDGGDSLIGIESTVVKVINEIPVILRPGKITPEDIIKVVGKVNISKNLNKLATGNVESPGMKYKHYAPKSKCILIYSKNEYKLIEEINNNIIDNTYVLGFIEHKNKINTTNFYSLGSINNLEEISHNIFSLLREIDRLNPNLIIIEGVKKEGLGIAIMNRLIKSCSHNYIEK